MPLLDALRLIMVKGWCAAISRCYVKPEGLKLLQQLHTFKSPHHMKHHTCWKEANAMNLTSFLLEQACA